MVIAPVAPSISMPPHVCAVVLVASSVKVPPSEVADQVATPELVGATPAHDAPSVRSVPLAALFTAAAWAKVTNNEAMLKERMGNDGFIWKRKAPFHNFQRMAAVS
jgi:hypothetical protein